LKELHSDIPIKCECGRVIAFLREGKVYVRCKKCKREVEIPKAKDR
jgi:hypothetical protein